MPKCDKIEMRCLHRAAATFRRLAEDFPAPLSTEMLKMAADLEKRASNIAARVALKAQPFNM